LSILDINFDCRLAESVVPTKEIRYLERPDVPYPRVIDVATLNIPLSYVFVMTFERFPVWLLSLEPIWTTNIYFPEYESVKDLLDKLEARAYPVELVERALGRHGTFKIHFGSPPGIQLRCLNLVSGSLHYIQHIFSGISATGLVSIAVLDHHC
jgi:hypothetical protein